jgi:predicted PurR-regulated permease PerM
MNPTDKNKTKMYLTIGIITIVILIAWLLNFKNIIQKNSNTQNPEIEQNWHQITQDFNPVINNFQNIKQRFKQAPTSSIDNLQNSAKILPNQLKNIIENINLSSSTPSTTQSQLPN